MNLLVTLGASSSFSPMGLEVAQGLSFIGSSLNAGVQLNERTSRLCSNVYTPMLFSCSQMRIQPEFNFILHSRVSLDLLFLDIQGILPVRDRSPLLEFYWGRTQWRGLTLELLHRNGERIYDFSRFSTSLH